MSLNPLHDDYGDVVQHLAAQRDELRLQMHLFGMEAKQQWEEAEHRWEHLRATAKVIGAEAGHSSGEIKEALELVVEEIGTAYDRMRRLL